MYKTILILALISNLFTAVAQTTLLRGKITLQNSGGQPVQGVQISSFGTNPTTSNTFGEFELVFNEKNPGDDVTLTVVKSGMEVVNRDALKQVILRKDPDDFIEIVLCPEGQRDEFAASLYDITFNAYQEKVKELNEEIKHLPANSERVKELEYQVAEYQRDWIENQEIIKGVIQQFTAINLDNADRLYSVAFNHFINGNIEAAINTLSSETLTKNLNDTKKELLRIENLENTLSEQKRIAQTNLEKTIQTYILKANLLITQFKWEDAEYNYELATRADTTSFKNVYGFAVYLNFQNKYDKALHWFNMALKLAESDFEYAVVMDKLGWLYIKNRDYTTATDTLKNALIIIERLATKYPTVYKNDLIISLTNLGVAYLDQNNFTEADIILKRALTIVEGSLNKDFKLNDENLASLYTNLGILHHEMHDYSGAEKYYNIALSIREKLAESKPGIYEPDIALTLNNLGLFRMNNNHYKAAEDDLNRALEIYKRLSAINPWGYEPFVASTLNNLGMLHNRSSEYNSSETEYKESLQIYERLATFYPRVYEQSIATLLNNLGMLYHDKDELFKSLINLYGALEIRERLAIENPQVFEPILASTLNTLGGLYVKFKNYTAANQAYDRALKIRENLAFKNPKKFEYDLSTTLNDIGSFYIIVKKYPAAKDAFNSALEIQELLASSIPQVYEPEIAMTLNNLGLLYMNIKDYSAAENPLERSLEIYIRFSKNNINAYNSLVAMTSMNFGILYNYWFDETKDVDIIEKGLYYVRLSEETLLKCPDSPNVQKFKLEVQRQRKYFTKAASEYLK